MALEIERKFLVRGERWRALKDELARAHSQGKAYQQGYIYTHNGTTIRVRIAGESAYLTIKGKTSGTTRAEYEYAIPLTDALEMLQALCDRPLIEKTRYKIERGGLIWEIDEFRGDNQGLLLAEVELTSADQSVDLPDWIGREVTQDPRYYNANLVKYPYNQWPENSRRT